MSIVNGIKEVDKSGMDIDKIGIKKLDKPDISIANTTKKLIN